MRKGQIVDIENGYGPATEASPDGMAPADWTTADEIRRRTFSTAHEGYDREEVRAYLEGLAEWFVTLNTQMGNLRRAQPAVAPVPAQAAGSPGELAVRMAEILQDAEAHARQVREEAERESERLVADARTAADRAGADTELARREVEEKTAAALALRQAILDELRGSWGRLEAIAAGWSDDRPTASITEPA